MKQLNPALRLVFRLIEATMILYSIVSILRWWFFPPGFTDLIDQKLSPDGRIVASYVVENHGPMTGTTYGLTLSAAGADVLQGQPILTEGEDDEAIAYRWLSDDALLVRLVGVLDQYLSTQGHRPHRCYLLRAAARGLSCDRQQKGWSAGAGVTSRSRP